MAVDELVVDAPRHVGEGELALLGGQGGVEHHLEQQVAQLLLEVAVAVAAGDIELAAWVEGIDRLQHLVGLLQQVPGEGGVGLLPVPRAAFPQRAHQLGEAGHLGGDGGGQHRHIQRGQVVGLHLPVEIVPGHGAHRLVGQAQPGQHDRLGRRRAVDGELDLRQHVAGVALGHQQGPPLARRLHREPMPVDEADAGRHRVDPQPGPRQVGERQPGHQLDVDPLVGQQQLDGPLGHQRRARGRRRAPRRPRRGPPSDAASTRASTMPRVDVVERGRRLVQGVEADGGLDRGRAPGGGSSGGTAGGFARWRRWRRR